MPSIYHAGCTSGRNAAPHDYDRGMEARELGRSGVTVTRVVLGCGNFGGVGSSPAFFGQGIAKEVALRIMDTAWDLGIRAFDTADAYGGGRSESWIGEWLASKDGSARDELVVETKTFNPMADGEDHGLGRRRILRQIETSLERLGLERVPLYMAHAFDDSVPQEETLSAFDELVRSGKVGAIGASNFTGDQLAEALEISELEDLARYELVQNSHSLLAHGDAETVFPVCREHGIGYECFGPLAGGWLSGRYRRGEAYPDGSRMAQRPEGYRAYATDTVFDALERFEREASERGVSMAGLALAWLLSYDEITAVVVGPGRPEHLDPVREALELRLDHAEAEALTEVFA
jgi:aryl-alcohol dehydrogenase-like predicted oxidoreductase